MLSLFTVCFIFIVTYRFQSPFHIRFWLLSANPLQISPSYSVPASKFNRLYFINVYYLMPKMCLFTNGAMKMEKWRKLTISQFATQLVSTQLLVPPTTIRRSKWGGTKLQIRIYASRYVCSMRDECYSCYTPYAGSSSVSSYTRYIWLVSWRLRLISFHH